LERKVRHCLKKNPAQRFQSAGDLAFNLEALTEGSGVGKTSAQTAIAETVVAETASAETTALKKEVASRSKLFGLAGTLGLAAMMGLGWWWSNLSDLTPDGRKVLFDEEGDGGGPNYTVFLRDTDGSPPVRIGEGASLAISPDAKWAITQSAKGGPLSLVPTGTGEARQLTHDDVSYQEVRWLAGGKELLASGIEAGHGARDYVIEVSNGNSRPITPEGVGGVQPSPDAGARPCWDRMENGDLAAGWERSASDSGAGLELPCEWLVAG
jgi:hypothetical protein